MESKFAYPDLSPSAPAQYQQLPPPPPYSSTESHPSQGVPYPVGPSHQPPPPGMAPGMVPPQSTAVIVSSTSFGAYPQNAPCPACNQTVITVTNHKAGILTWLASAGCCLIGCFLGCCLIPCCTDFTRDVEHSCPKCGRQLGLHRRI